MKLRNDFGVAALLGTIILVGTFAILITGIVLGQITVPDIIPTLAGWVGVVLACYFVVKGMKEKGNK